MVHYLAGLSFGTSLRSANLARRRSLYCCERRWNIHTCPWLSDSKSLLADVAYGLTTLIHSICAGNGLKLDLISKELRPGSAIQETTAVHALLSCRAKYLEAEVFYQYQSQVMQKCLICRRTHCSRYRTRSQHRPPESRQYSRCRQFTALRRKMKPSITDRAVLNKDLQQRNAAQHLFTLASLIASLEHSVDPIKPRQKMAHLLETSNPSLNTVTLPIKAQPIQKEPDHQLTPRQTSRLDEEVVE